MARKRTLRGQVAIAGIGESVYYKHGKSPDAQFKLLLTAILNAAQDAGIDPREIDGISSYANDAKCPRPSCRGARYEAVALFEHGLGGRRRRRFRGGGQRSRSYPFRNRRLCRRISWTGSGTGRAIRIRRALPNGRCGGGRDVDSVRNDVTCANLCDAHDSTHVRTRHRTQYDAFGRDGCLSPRTKQPPCGHAWASPGRGKI